MQLDHVFLFVDDIAAAERLGASFGLSETYRRRHPRQGTANICYAFGNAYLELLVMEDAAEAQLPPIARTGLYERSQWQTKATCPIGLSWRFSPGEETEPFETWAFRPPYLPDGMDIRVAADGDDPAQPMMFRSPGRTPPAEWPPERRQDLQIRAGLTLISRVLLTCPITAETSRTLNILTEALPLDIQQGEGTRWGLTLLGEGADGRIRELVLL